MRVSQRVPSLWLSLPCQYVKPHLLLLSSIPFSTGPTIWPLTTFSHGFSCDWKSFCHTCASEINLGIMAHIPLAPLSNFHRNFQNSTCISFIGLRNMHPWIFVYLCGFLDWQVFWVKSCVSSFSGMCGVASVLLFLTEST